MVTEYWLGGVCLTEEGWTRIALAGLSVGRRSSHPETRGSPSREPWPSQELCCLRSSLDGRPESPGLPRVALHGQVPRASSPAPRRLCARVQGPEQAGPRGPAEPNTQLCPQGTELHRGAELHGGAQAPRRGPSSTEGTQRAVRVGTPPCGRHFLPVLTLPLSDPAAFSGQDT